MPSTQREAKRMVALLAALAGLCALAAVTTRAEAAVPTLEITVLSNRADLISGGDALVEVVLPPKVRVRARITS